MIIRQSPSFFLCSRISRYPLPLHAVRRDAQIRHPFPRIRQQYIASAAPHLTLPPPPPPIRRGVFRFVGAFIFYTTLGLIMAAAPHIANGNYNFVPPTDAETLTLFHPDPESQAAEIERYIQSHPFIEELYADEELIPARPHLKIPPALRPLNLTGGTLLGDNKIGVPPLAFTTRDGSRYVSIQYLGPALCGHPGIVHGGLLATLLDEGLARCCFPALPNKVGVTASLKIDYKKPTKAEQYVVLRAETTKVEGRKAWVKGWIEALPSPDEYTASRLRSDLNGVIDVGTNGTNGDAEKKLEAAGPMRLVEAEALFVEPKNAGTMMRVYSSQSDSAVASTTNSPGKYGKGS